MSDLNALAQVLTEADEAHAADVFALGDFTEAEVTYLASVGDLEDPLTDGLECDR